MLSTGKDAIEQIVRSITSGKTKKIYDLGSGSGKVISRVANSYPKMECVGIECNLGAYYLARLRNIFSNKNITYRRADFFKVDLGDADVVYLYLFPEIVERLEVKFAKELKKGTVVIANTFPLKSRKPKKVIPGNVGLLDTLYIYEY